MLEGLLIIAFLPSLIKILAAVLPAVYLLRYVNQTDRLEPEPPGLLKALVGAGMLSTLIAIVLEFAGEAILRLLLNEDSILFNVLLYFIVVALSEEGAKYVFLKRKTWNSAEFNCQYDGVVYAVFISLGFALLENIEYVFIYGMSTALLRALTAIPGHACFSVYMGVFYGAAKRAENVGQGATGSILRKLAVLVPAVIHGAYDYIATVSQSVAFIVFVGVLFYLTFRLIKRSAEHDRGI